MMYNVVVTVSCTVCVPAESSREAIDAVNKGITNHHIAFHKSKMARQFMLCHL